jgi:DNA-binding GntR family transcriptional regulator
MTKGTGSMKSLIAYEKVRDLILSGSKLPGTRLVLSELENELNISKGPLREALMRLDRSGLVHNMPYKGCVVARPPQLEEMQIMFEQRLDLECRLAKEAIRKITKKQISRLEEMVKSSMAITRTDNRFFNCNKIFHVALCECSGMTHLCLILDRFLELVEVFHNLYYSESKDCTKYNNDHGLIIQALKNKDAVMMETVLRRNIEDGMDMVSSVYRAKIKPPAE